MGISEILSRIGADSLFRRNGHPPPGDRDIKEIYDFLRYGDKPSSRVGYVDENSLTLNPPPDSPGRQST